MKYRQEMAGRALARSLLRTHTHTHTHTHTQGPWEGIHVEVETHRMIAWRRMLWMRAQQLQVGARGLVERMKQPSRVRGKSTRVSPQLAAARASRFPPPPPLPTTLPRLPLFDSGLHDEHSGRVFVTEARWPCMPFLASNFCPCAHACMCSCA